MLSENYIIDRILELCEEKGISRYRLAKMAGLSQSSLSTLLNRKSVPTIQTLDKICDGFGITISQFFAGSDTHPDLTEEQEKLLNAWDELFPEERALVKAYIQGISRK